MFTIGVFFLVCCICRLPELISQLRFRREITSQSSSEANHQPEIKQLTAAAIFVNPSGNSISVGTLSEDIGQIQADQSKEQEGVV